MGLFHLSRPPQLKPDWIYRSQGIIWRLLVSADGASIVGEERDVETKKVTAFALRLLDGAVLWNNVGLQESWWIGLEDVSTDTVFLHTFASPDLPGHKGLRAMDLLSGQILWEEKELRLLFRVDNRLWCEPADGNASGVVEVDGRTGIAVGSVTHEEVRRLAEGITTSNRIPVRLPEPLTDEGVEHRVRSAFASVQKGGGTLTAIEHVEHQHAVIAAGYTSGPAAKEPVVLMQHLLIVDNQRSGVRYSDIILGKASAVVPDGFFCCTDTVVYVREKHELVGVSLLPLLKESQGR